jgi:peroxiredoxin
VTRALDSYLEPAARPPFRLLELAVWAGEMAPDFLFPYADERRMALRRLRGRPVTLFFWKSWSSACLSELRRMQRLHERQSRRHGLILAINDGESDERIEAVRRRYGLTLPLIADPRRLISRRYGLPGWPTTVTIDERGVVSRIIMGAPDLDVR